MSGPYLVTHDAEVFFVVVTQHTDGKWLCGCKFIAPLLLFFRRECQLDCLASVHGFPQFFVLAILFHLRERHFSFGILHTPMRTIVEYDNVRRSVIHIFKLIPARARGESVTLVGFKDILLAVFGLPFASHPLCHVGFAGFVQCFHLFVGRFQEYRAHPLCLVFDDDDRFAVKHFHFRC